MKSLIISTLLFTACFLNAGLVLRLKDGQQMNLYSDYHALIIGNSNYQHFPKLRGVKKDVKDLKAMFAKMNISTTVIEDCTGDQMKKALSDFVDVYGDAPDRALIFYYAGHGHTEPLADGSKLGYIVPTDAPLYEDNKADFRKKSISMSEIENIAKLIQSKHVLMIFDSCFSGTIFTLKRAAPQDITDKTSQPVRQFIASGTENEAVPDQSIFKATFIKGVGDGFADYNQDGYVTGEELVLYLKDQVVYYSKGNQHPQYGKIANPNLDRGDFVFAINAPSEEKPVSRSSPRPAVKEPTIDAHYAEMERLTGDLRITTDFDTELFIDRISQGFVKAGHALNVRALTIGEHLLDIFYFNAKISQSLMINEGETTMCNLKQSEIKSKIKNSNSFTLYSEPSGAALSLEGYAYIDATTPFIFVDPSPSSYTVTLSLPRYMDAMLSFDTKRNQKVEKTIAMETLFGNLKVSSEPAGCRVILNNAYMGVTPLDLSGEKKGLTPGVYSLKIESDNEKYSPIQKQITIKKNETLVEHISMQIIPDMRILQFQAAQKKVKIMLTDPNGAKSSSKGSAQKLYPGTYSYVASKWGYYTDQQSIELTENKVYTANINLQPLPKSMLQQHGKWKAQKLGSLGILAASLATAGYMYQRADADYKSYQKAFSPHAASSRRESYLKSRRNYYISLSVNILPAAWYGYSLFKGAKTSKLIKTEMNSRIQK